MTAYVGGRRHVNGYGHNRHHHDDPDLDLYGRRRTRSGSWRSPNRRGFDEPDFGDDLLGAREAKLSTLQHHLEDLKEDNRQMSLRLNQAEGCIQDLEYDDGGLMRNSPSLVEDYDRPVSRLSLAENDRQRRLRRELREIRDDLNAVRGSIQPTTVDDMYLTDGRGLSPSSRRRRLRHHHLDDNEIGDWGSRQLEGISLARQRSDLDYGCGHSSVQGINPSASYVGYRSVFPRPLLTQRNKFQQSPLMSRRFDLNYANDDTVFMPSSPAELSIGDRVKVSRNGGTSHGRVRYIGHLPGKVGPYLGLELENEGGKHDGIYNGFRYFQCKGYRGVFVPFDRVVLAWRQ